MTDHTSKDFDQAIGPTPPSTVDVDRVIARERRRSWLRASPVAMAAAAIVAISAGAVTLSGPGEAPATAPPPLSETQTYCPGNTPTAPRLPVNIEDAAQ